MTTPASACGWSVYNWLLDDRPRPCGELATSTVMLGCVHEHLSPCLSCPACSAGAQRQPLFCTPCRDAGYPEVPVIVVQVRPLTVPGPQP